MARPGLKEHPKFKRLVHILGEPRPHVIGYLECLWSVGYQNGDPFLGDELSVEVSAEFPGERGKLVQALLECALIDKLEGGTYQIHDLLDHAPDYVKRRRLRELGRKKRGRSVTVKSRSVTGQWRSSRSRQDEDGAPPAPAPAPAPAPKEEIPPTPSLAKPANGQSWESFLTTEWVFYFRGTAKTERDHETLDKFFAALIAQGSKPEEILVRIRDPSRKRTEPTWEFEKRLSANGRRNEPVRSLSRVGTSREKLDAIEAKTHRAGAPENT